MKATLLLIVLLISAGTTAQTVAHESDIIEIEGVSGDTLHVSGSWAAGHIDYEQTYRWYLYKDGRWWGMFVGKEANPDLRCMIEPGEWKIVRYTDFHQGETIPVTTKSNEIWFQYLGRAVPVDYETRKE